MQRSVLAVDVDGVILPNIGTDWFYYMKGHYDLKPKFKHIEAYRDRLPYDITELFDTEYSELDGFEFWRNAFLYENKVPEAETIAVLQKLQEHVDIVFVSKCYGEHVVSKTEMLNKYFPFHNGIILTADKHYVKCEYIVDDNIGVLNSMPKEVKCFRFRTDYSQKDGIQKREWKTIYNFEQLHDSIMSDISAVRVE